MADQLKIKEGLVTNEELQKIISKFEDRERGFVSTFSENSRRQLLYALLIEGKKKIKAVKVGKARIGYELSDDLKKRLITNNFSGVVVDEAVSQLEKQNIIEVK